MRKIKVNLEQVLEAIAAHLEALHYIRQDEHVHLSPLRIKDGMIEIYVHKNKGEG